MWFLYCCISYQFLYNKCVTNEKTGERRIFRLTSWQACQWEGSFFSISVNTPSLLCSSIFLCSVLFCILFLLFSLRECNQLHEVCSDLNHFEDLLSTNFVINHRMLICPGSVKHHVTHFGRVMLMSISFCGYVSNESHLKWMFCSYHY